MRLREIAASKEKTAVITFGRFNPPTTGHKVLVDKMLEFRGDHYIFLSHKHDLVKNLLSYKDKRFFVEKFFPDVTIGPKDIHSPLQALEYVFNQGYTKVLFVVGSDRVQSFSKMIADNNGKTFKFKFIEVINAGDRKIADGSDAGMSSSKLRSIAARGDFARFQQGVPSTFLAKELYDLLRKAIKSSQSKSKQLVGETASAGASSAGGIASSVSSKPINKRSKTRSQRKNKDGTVKNALDYNGNIFTGNTIRR